MKLIPEKYECLFTDKEMSLFKEIDKVTDHDEINGMYSILKLASIDLEDVIKKIGVTKSEAGFMLKRIESLIGLITTKRIIENVNISFDIQEMQEKEYKIAFTEYVKEYSHLYSINDRIVNDYFLNHSCELINSFNQLSNIDDDKEKDEIRHSIYHQIQNDTGINEDDIKSCLVRLCLLEDLINSKIKYILISHNLQNL